MVDYNNVDMKVNSEEGLVIVETSKDGEILYTQRLPPDVARQLARALMLHADRSELQVEAGRSQLH